MIQYPKNTHVTLPSVEGGFGTLNILRDPPKSIHTRFIPKVGETSKITEWIDSADGGDRICEGINVYARGVNPMVSVSYSNYGTNGGQMRYRGGMQGTDQNPLSSGSGQSYLPYRVMREGAFRPPIIPPQELLPLSRLPRANTVQQTNPGSSMTRVVNSMNCQKDMKAIRDQLLQVCAPSRAIFNIQTPSSKPYREIKHHIADRVQSVATTNPKAQSYKLGLNAIPDKGVHKDIRHASVISNPYQNIQINSVSSLAGNQPMPIQEKLNSTCNTNPSTRGSVQNYMHNSKQLEKERMRPVSSMTINPNRPIDMNANVNSSSFARLPPRASLGGFHNTGFQQSTQYLPDMTSSTKSQLQQNSVYQKAASAQDARLQFNKPFLSRK